MMWIELHLRRVLDLMFGVTALLGAGFVAMGPGSSALAHDQGRAATCEASDCRTGRRFADDGRMRVSGFALQGPAADLAVTATVSNGVPIEGEEIVYAITVTNNGPSSATGVSVANQLPTSVTFVGVDAVDQGVYHDGLGTWDVGVLGSGVGVQLTVRASVDIGAATTTGSGEFVDVFASGNGLDAPAGLTFGPDDHLYVSSRDSDRVLRFNGATGAFIDVFAIGGGLDGPGGLVFGPDGALYVVGLNSNAVHRFDGTTGAFVDVFANDGGIDTPRGIVFGPDDHLYVTSRTPSEVLRFNGVTGAFIDVFASGGGLDNPRGVLFGLDGHLYVAGRDSNAVHRYDGVTGAFLDVFAAGARRAYGIAYGPEGRFYVSQALGHDTVQRYDGNTGMLIDTFASGNGLTTPWSIVFGPDGNLYVSSFATNEVLRYQGFITNVATVSANEIDPDILDNRAAVGITPLANPGLEIPAVFPAEGAPIVHAIADLDTSSATNGTVDVAVVIPNGTVQIFLNLGNDLDGEWQGLEPQLPVIPVGSNPTDIAIGDVNGDGYQDFVVTSAAQGGGSVSWFFNAADDTGTFVAGPTVGGFNDPRAVALGHFGASPGLAAAVADQGESEITILEDIGPPLAVIPVPGGPIALDPRDLDDDKDVDLAVSTADGTVVPIRNEPAGAFTALLPGVSVGMTPVDVLAIDLNQDAAALPEIATANTDGTLAILRNISPPMQLPQYEAEKTLLAGLLPSSVDAVDLDGDGDRDLVSTTRDSLAGPALLIFENLTGESLDFADPVPITVGGGEPQYVLNGDFNADGAVDLVTVNIDPAQINGGSVTVFINELPCPGDQSGDSTVDFIDLLAVISQWGPCQPGVPCPGDVDANGVVGFGDLLLLIAAWGMCP